MGNILSKTLVATATVSILGPMETYGLAFSASSMQAATTSVQVQASAGAKGWGGLMRAEDFWKVAVDIVDQWEKEASFHTTAGKQSLEAHKQQLGTTLAKEWQDYHDAVQGAQSAEADYEAQVKQKAEKVCNDLNDNCSTRATRESVQSQGGLEVQCDSCGTGSNDGWYEIPQPPQKPTPDIPQKPKLTENFYTTTQGEEAARKTLSAPSSVRVEETVAEDFDEGLSALVWVVARPENIKSLQLEEFVSIFPTPDDLVDYMLTDSDTKKQFEKMYKLFVHSYSSSGSAGAPPPTSNWKHLMEKSQHDFESDFPGYAQMAIRNLSELFELTQRRLEPVQETTKCKHGLFIFLNKLMKKYHDSGGRPEVTRHENVVAIVSAFGEAWTEVQSETAWAESCVYASKPEVFTYRRFDEAVGLTGWHQFKALLGFSFRLWGLSSKEGDTFLTTDVEKVPSLKQSVPSLKTDLQKIVALFANTFSEWRRIIEDIQVRLDWPLTFPEKGPRPAPFFVHQNERLHYGGPIKTAILGPIMEYTQKHDLFQQFTGHPQDRFYASDIIWLVNQITIVVNRERQRGVDVAEFLLP